MEKKTERRRRQREGDETYLGMVAKEKKQRLVTMLECNEDDARVRRTRCSNADRDLEASLTAFQGLIKSIGIKLDESGEQKNILVTVALGGVRLLFYMFCLGTIEMHGHMVLSIQQWDSCTTQYCSLIFCSIGLRVEANQDNYSLLLGCRGIWDGSTEWVEQNLIHLGSKAIAYINVDCAMQGPGFFVGSTP
ncbi:hypothetical protein JHK85_044027 [Glycine max]|nr:hypothetical protein JHK85_044027 [Glycine max]